MAEELKRGMPVAEALDLLIGRNSEVKLPVYCNKKALVVQATPTNGGLFNWQNPLSVKVIAMVIMNVRTASTGAATADVGRAGDATNTGDTFLDAANLQTAVPHCSFESAHKGTNGLAARLIDEKGGTNDFITGTSSANNTGLVGDAYILFIPVS